MGFVGRMELRMLKLTTFSFLDSYSAATKEEILQSGMTVASLFFKNVFGTQAQKALTVFVALSALGNVLTVVSPISP